MREGPDIPPPIGWTIGRAPEPAATVRFAVYAPKRRTFWQWLRRRGREPGKLIAQTDLALSTYGNCVQGIKPFPVEKGQPVWVVYTPEPPE